MRTIERTTSILFILAAIGFATAALQADQPAPRDSRAEPKRITDPVGFPANYRSTLRLLSVATRDQEPAIMTLYGNDLAASVTRADQLPYPDGAVLAMEFANTRVDAAHQPVRDAQGKLQAGEVMHVDVMRRGKGSGASHGASGANLTDEWEYMSYLADGSRNTQADPAGCAACHAKAGAAKDFVFRISTPQDASPPPSR